jgi:hypothetical protein
VISSYVWLQLLPCLMCVLAYCSPSQCCLPACLPAPAAEPEPEPSPPPPPVVVVAAPPPLPPPRRVLEPPKFNPPNLSVPRPRKKSRGIKPSPEDAIKRDPRVITLYNELSRGQGVVAATVGWVRGADGATASPASSAGGTPSSSRRASGVGVGGTTPRGAGSASPSPLPSARRASSTGGSPAPGAAAGTPGTPVSPPLSPEDSSAAAAAEMELTEEEAAAFLPTLPARAAAVSAFQPSSLQDVSDFVSDVAAQGGDAPRSGHAAAGFPSSRWRAMADAAATFDQLLDMCDTLTKWQTDPQVGGLGWVWVAGDSRLASWLAVWVVCVSG